MDPLAISVASGIRSRIESLDVLANNLSNAETHGFKADYSMFSLYSADGGGAPLADLDKNWVDFSAGPLRLTSNPTDVAIAGEGFFAVDGPDGVLYTRNGSFKLSPTGVLMTAEDYPVRGVGGVRITINSNRSLDFDSAGNVRQDGNAVARLELVNFKDKTELAKVGGSYFRNNGGNPDPATKLQVLQGRLEGSNVNIAQSAIRLVELMRQSEMLNKAVGMNGDMNRKSVEDVAKTNV